MRDENDRTGILDWPLLPQTIIDGRFLCKGELGKQGGMSRCFRVADSLWDNTIFVLKMMYPGLHSNARARDLFDRESKLTFALGKQNRAFVQVHHRGYIDLRLHHPDGSTSILNGVQYYAMEMLAGGDIQDFILGYGRRKIFVPLSVAIALSAMTAGALKFLHGKNIAHCDLKPNNLFVHCDEGGGIPYIKMIDFGVSIRIGDRPIPGTGTAAYHAPEVLAADLASKEALFSRLDVEDRKKADIYSLGLVFYELFALRAPFICETKDEYAHAHMFVTPEPLGKLRPDMPPVLAAMVMRMLDKNPNMRPYLAEIEAAFDAHTRPDLASATINDFLVKLDHRPALQHASSRQVTQGPKVQLPSDVFTRDGFSSAPPAKAHESAPPVKAPAPELPSSAPIAPPLTAASVPPVASPAIPEPSTEAWSQGVQLAFDDVDVDEYTGMGTIFKAAIVADDEYTPSIFEPYYHHHPAPWLLPNSDAGPRQSRAEIRATHDEVIFDDSQRTESSLIPTSTVTSHEEPVAIALPFDATDPPVATDPPAREGATTSEALVETAPHFDAMDPLAAEIEPSVEVPHSVKTVPADAATTPESVVISAPRRTAAETSPATQPDRFGRGLLAGLFIASMALCGIIVIGGYVLFSGVPLRFNANSHAGEAPSLPMSSTPPPAASVAEPTTEPIPQEMSSPAASSPVASPQAVLDAGPSAESNPSVSKVRRSPERKPHNIDEDLPRELYGPELVDARSSTPATRTPKPLPSTPRLKVEQR